MYTEQELIEKAEPVFENNPDCDALLTSSDGQFFPEQNEQDFRFHLQRGGKGLKGYIIFRDAEEDESQIMKYEPKKPASN